MNFIKIDNLVYSPFKLDSSLYNPLTRKGTASNKKIALHELSSSMNVQQNPFGVVLFELVKCNWDVIFLIMMILINLGNNNK